MQVLEACELIPDIQAMPSGDATRVTDCGDNLSGGQRARVSLARTLYTRSDIYLLDDCLAALDGRVAACVLRSLLYSPLMGHATVIMTSSHQPSIAAADFVISMEHGRIASVVGQGGRAAVDYVTQAGGQMAWSPTKRRSALGRPRSRSSRSFETSLPHFLLEDAWEQCITTREQWEPRIAAGEAPPWVAHAQALHDQGGCSRDMHQSADPEEEAVGATEAGLCGNCSSGEQSCVPEQGVAAPQARTSLVHLVPA